MAERGSGDLKRYGNLYREIVSFKNLLLASKKAFRGKRDKHKVAEFYFDLEKELLRLQEEMFKKTYEPRPLRTFLIFEPKEREIGASDFRDRGVHHAVCNVVEPIFERGFTTTATPAGKERGPTVQSGRLRFSAENTAIF